MVNWSVLTAGFLQAIILVAESSRRMVLTSQSGSDFSAGTENIMWKELWWAKDFAMSVVPRGRRRWSSQWVIWGLVPADKVSQIKLVVSSWYFDEDLGTLLSSHKKKGIIFLPLLLRCWCPARESFTSLFSVHPTSHSADQPPDSYSSASQTSLPMFSRHILDNLYPFPQSRFWPPTTTQTSRALCCQTHQQRFKSMSGGSWNVTPVEKEAAEFCLCCSKGPCTWISVGYFDLSQMMCCWKRYVIGVLSVLSWRRKWQGACIN